MTPRFCAIVDANCMSDFIAQKKETYSLLLNRLTEKSGQGVLFLGGKLKCEVEAISTKNRLWLRVARQRGYLENSDEQEVKRQTQEVRKSGDLASNDPHVIALAQVSGARLLVSNDEELRKDFKKRQFLQNPRGKILPDKISQARDLLNKGGLCAA